MKNGLIVMSALPIWKKGKSGLIVMGDLSRKNGEKWSHYMGDLPRWKNSLIVMGDLPRWKKGKMGLIVMDDLLRWKNGLIVIGDLPK